MLAHLACCLDPARTNRTLSDQVVPGELSIVTGVPNSGKSEWIDALLCNLAEQWGWSFAMCSMEKKARSLSRLAPRLPQGAASKHAAPDMPDQACTPSSRPASSTAGSCDQGERRR
jgi:hypothetical protein